MVSAKNAEKIGERKDVIREMERIRQVSEKDFSIMYQKCVAEALKLQDLVILKELFRKFPRKMKNYDKETRKIIEESYIKDFYKFTMDNTGNENPRSSVIVDLEVEFDLTCRTRPTGGVAAGESRGLLQRALDEVGCIIDSCWVCVLGEPGQVQQLPDGALLMQVLGHGENGEARLDLKLNLLEYISFRVIPVITRNSRYRDVILDLNVFFQKVFKVFDFSKFANSPDPQRNPQEFQELVKNIDIFVFSMINILKALVARFNGKLAHYAGDILSIIEKGLDKGDISAKKKIYGLLAATFENVPSFSNLDFSRLMEIIEKDWNLSEGFSAVDKKPEENKNKKRKITIQKIQSYYDDLPHYLSIRKELVNVFYQMVKYDSSLYGNHDIVACTLQDLLQMRIDHFEDNYEDYHVQLLRFVSELMISNYPKHIFPLVLHGLQKAYYSKHLAIKSASIYGLRICEAIANRRSAIPTSIDLPIKHDNTRVHVELEISQGSQYLETNEIDNEEHHKTERTESVDISRNLIEKEESIFHKLPNINNESIGIEVAEKLPVAAKEEEKESGFISLVLEEDENAQTKNPPTDENGTPQSLFISSKLEENRQSMTAQDEQLADHGQDIFISSGINESDSDDSNVSGAFSMPEINIDSSDNDE